MIYGYSATGLSLKVDKYVPLSPICIYVDNTVQETMAL